jgi:hypothetical protein
LTHSNLAQGPRPHDPGQFSYIPFSASGGALLFRLLSKLYKHSGVIITTNPSFGESAAVFSAAKSRYPRSPLSCCHILEPGNDSFRFKNSSAKAAKPTKELP